jgi:hypothetical protein
MAEMSRDREAKLSKEMRWNSMTVRLTQLLAGSLLVFGVWMTAWTILRVPNAEREQDGLSLIAGMVSICIAVVLYLIAQAVEDIRKNRIAAQSLLQLQRQQAIYLSEIQALLSDSAIHNERSIRLQIQQSRSLNEIGTLLDESSNHPEDRMAESEDI